MRRKNVLLTVLLIVSLALLWRVGGAAATSLRGNSPNRAPKVALAPAYDSALMPKLPTQMNYQGFLQDADGHPMDGSHHLTFTIYASMLSNLWPPQYTWTEVYSETQTVQVTDGVFNVVIGSQEPLDPDIFEGITLENHGLQLGVKVDGGAELTPRMDLLPVPYAFRAEYVDRFPAPHYDSGWYTIGPRPDPTTISFSHHLGGNIDNYVIDLECEYTYGGVSACPSDDASWNHLTDQEIEVTVSNNSNLTKVRLRIWRID